jgi:L-seryl-tRNA(Ser) seleniumtransferase
MAARYSTQRSSTSGTLGTLSNFRLIPSIEQLRQRPAVARLAQTHGATATTDALRQAAESARAAMASGRAFDSAEAVAAEIEAAAGTALAHAARGSLRPVINATGVIIHTNLGRAPLPLAALERILEVCRGYTNLEYDLEAGRRGSRLSHAEQALTALTGAEAAVVVNNNAAATLLILAAIGSGREVVISRGELVEIGGGFRVPDVMAQSGAVLREVGTTNRTRIADYLAALTPRTAMLLRVHPSNFRIEGFTERPGLRELVDAAHGAEVPLVEDLGSGLVDGHVVAGEPTVQQSLLAGVDLVCFSGDKLLGGPQAGIIVGRRALVEQLKRHPLMRALRVDKLTLAALEGTLHTYRTEQARSTVPVLDMILATTEQLEKRAHALCRRVARSDLRMTVVPGVSTIGGGSAPGIEIPTALLALERDGWSADALEARLRNAEPPVIARIEQDRVLLDVRTVSEAQEHTLVQVLATI